MKCPKCGFEIVIGDGLTSDECPQCGVILSKAKAKVTATLARIQAATSIYNLPDQDQIEFLSGFIAATTDAFPGREIVSTYGVVFGQCSYAFDALGEAVVGLGRNIIGSGRSTKAETLLANARHNALAELKFAACKAGGDAVVGVRFDFEEISGANGRGILIVAASGTAVGLAQ